MTGPVAGQVEGPATYRAPLWSRLDEVDHAAAVEWALESGLCGVGGRLGSAPRDLDDAVDRVTATWDRRVADRLRRFAAVEDGSVVWTRTAEGLFHRGVLSGPWRYDASPTAYDVDLTHVRACRWSTDPVDPPPPVLATYARGGRNFQEVRQARRP